MTKSQKLSIEKALQAIEKTQVYIEKNGICIEVERELMELLEVLEKSLCEEVSNKALIEYKNCINMQAFFNLRNQIETHELKKKTHIVFFPYNASMWDSLESVWKAGIDDENCEVKVVPIPYYERTPDGGFGEMHYEGKMLPSYVSTVDWREYDLKEERPDIAYIHNPYDEYNRVTSVYPEFYSKEIKKYAGKLVYIPYYLFVNDMVRKEMIWVPGVINADYVICQSEKCCKQSVEIYDIERRKIKQTADGNNKFLPLGSPIVDKINQSKEEELPEEWKRLIYSGGIKKKVLFYNTHLGCVMGDNTEKFFKKINWFFEFLKEREDIVLLWRPHPLMRATIQSMNPVVAERYDELVESYKKEGWGIYDETAELNRSIAISDMYYGDWSSVATMFQEAGKPVMLEQLHILEEREAEDFYSTDLLIENENIWISMGNCGALLRYESKTESLVNEVCIKEESGIALYQKMVRYKSNLFLIPFNAKNIAIYNTDDASVSYIELNPVLQSACKFFDAIQMEDRYLYLFPTVYSYGIKLDMETQQIEYIPLLALRDQVKRDESEVLFYSTFVQNVSKIFMLLAESNTLVEYSTTENKFCTRILDQKDDAFISIAQAENDIWFVSRRTGEITKVSLHDWQVQSYQIDYSAVSSEARDSILNIRENGYVYSVYKNNQLYLVPDVGNYMIRICLNDFCAEQVQISVMNEYKMQGTNGKLTLCNNNIYCHMQCYNGIVCIDENDRVTLIDTKLDRAFYEENYALEREIGHVIVEDEYCYTLKKLCELSHNQQEIKTKNNNGLLIHKEIISK